MATQPHLNPLGPSARNEWRVSADAVNMIRAAVSARPVSVQDRNRTITFDAARTAIIVIDMQNDFCHPDGWLAHIGVDVTPARAPIEPLKALLPVLRKSDVPVIWVNWGNRADRANLSPGVLHVYNSDGVSIGIGDKLPARDAEVLQAGSWAAKVVDELTIEQDDICVDKYSMSGFHDTVLESILRNLGVTTLLFAGVNADQCVLCTLQDGNFRGFDCILLEDCSATTSPTFCMDATLYNVRQCFGFVCNSNEIREQLA